MRIGIRGRNRIVVKVQEERAEMEVKVERSDSTITTHFKEKGDKTGVGVAASRLIAILCKCELSHDKV